MKIEIVKTDLELKRCFPVMQQLRSQLTLEIFVERVNRQSKEYGYCLVYLEDADEVKSVAGFIIREMLPLGKFLYIDDIVTNHSDRSKGYGSWLFDWLVNYARVQGCAHLHLDSRLEREDAHRFYNRKGMNVTGYHFALKL